VVQKYYKRDTRVLQEWYKSITRGIQECYKSDTGISKAYHKSGIVARNRARKRLSDGIANRRKETESRE
jgi:hypothetical protein